LGRGVGGAWQVVNIVGLREQEVSSVHHLMDLLNAGHEVPWEGGREGGREREIPSTKAWTSPTATRCTSSCGALCCECACLPSARLHHESSALSMIDEDR
jgi:hypothetical protein